MLLFTGHQSPVRCVAYSPDGSMLASASDDFTVKLWDLATGAEITTLRGHRWFVTAVAFSPDGKTLTSGSWDKSVILWNLATRKQRLVLTTGNVYLVHSLAFTPDSTQLAVASGTAAALTFSADGSSLALATSREANTNRHETAVHCWDHLQGRLRLRLQLHPNDSGWNWVTDEPESFRLEHDRARIDCGGSVQQLLLCRKHDALAVAFAPDGQLLAWAVGRDVLLEETATGQPVVTLAGHHRAVNSLAFTPDGRALLSASWDRTVKLWDLSTNQERASFDWQIGKLYCVAFSPDGMTAAAAGHDGIVVWDMDN